MEPFPATFDRPMHSKQPSEPHVRIDELPALNRTRGGPPRAAANLRRANTVAQSGSLLKKNLELKATRDRTATATGALDIRAKNSQDQLRHASPLARSQTHRGPLEAARPPGRKAGHFTVGSVGQNGKIFLRPIANPPQNDRSITPFASIDQVTSDHLQPQRRAIARDDPSRWSSSQLSELRPREAEDVESVMSDAQPESRTSSRLRPRANSISTISEKQSVAGAGKRGELRIVIDRSEDRPRSADEKSPDTALGIPISNYRLGSPRFNQEGSATLQSSVYTRNSTSDNFRNSTLLGGTVDPMPARLQSPYSRDSVSRNRASFAVSMFSGAAAAIDLSRASPLPRNSMVYELKEPVEPSIYESLVLDMDAEAVVRYIPGTKDISAATPARIVAQISSESFMDYELVSDFFLTFRSYLSTDHLLALLLARLQWAINRPQDDGRIIRIRTFAALRHWILNYFVDDFVTSFDLRQNFCQTLNAMYQDVKSRENGGMSDLKILLDLKRCWNGKCSVYWTDSDFSQAYNDPDSPILPGSAEVNLPTSPGIPQQTIPLPMSATASTFPAETLSKESLPVTHHDRNDSAGTAQSIPLSSKSEQSIMALSCSLPPKSPRRRSGSYAKGKGPRPHFFGLSKSVSPHERPPTSPMMSRHPFQGHGHKRSGSFSDSVRDDRLPMYGLESSPIEPVAQEALDPVGLIRGALYPPAESYMALMAPDSPPLVQPASSSGPDRRSIPESGNKPAHSGVKTIIGSIRRAFHTRNGGHSVSARIAHASESLSMSSRGRTSAMPNNVALGSEYYRERKLAAIPRRQPRIDILCDQALQQYRQVLNNEEPIKEIKLLPVASAPAVRISAYDATQHVDSAKGKSGLTAESGSIVIVDDTGNEPPEMSGAVQQPATLAPNRFYTGHKVASSIYSSQRGSEQVVPLYFNNEQGNELSAPAPYQHHQPSPSSSSMRRSFSNERQQVPRKKPSLSLRLRKYASFQSGMSRYRSSIGSDATGKSYMSSNVGHDLAADHYQDPGPSLRRRPGGNLRQVQHVDELEPEPNRGTFYSHRSYDDSLTETTTSATDVASRPPTRLIPPNPHPQGSEERAQKNPRRSFESAIARFARIPDEDDGGIEITLLKLEGKWPSSPPPDQEHFPIGSGDGDGQGNPRWDTLSQRRQTDKSGYSYSTGTYSTAGAGGRLMPHRPYSDSVAESEESYNSIPLLERGLADESMKRPFTGRSNIGAPLSLIPSRDTSEFASSHPSIQVIDETESMRRIPPGSSVPQPGLLGGGESTPKHLSVPNSETSIDVVETRDGHLSVGSRSISSSTVDIPPHPLAHPPSPPMTIQHPNSFSSRTSPLGKGLVQPQVLTPETSPRRQGGGNLPLRDATQFSANVLQNSETGHIQRDFAKSHEPEHVPFVLACESQVLAQQLTLVEMAALSEVDWRDLVEMKWSNASQTIRSWVQFLYAADRKGIDLVVGRFNLMVKWVVSEIVLTNDLHEQARTIIKFIHTAVHARRISNYATMLQVAIALSSSDCTRLRNTWDLVPQEDKRLFKDMECLIQPVRNFHDLRVEMETANLQEGCIPFIGLYVHDLTYNAQKPAQVNGSNGGLLVNFERYRTAARIVKSLLRLIDASTKYRFEPVQGIIERCLWVSSLSEDDIQARSRQLE